MKKFLSILAAILFFSLSTSAQYKVVIRLNDGSTPIEKYVWDVDNITFEECSAIPAPPAAKLVDLGLSVSWASWNFGAQKESEVGHYIGWADTLGIITSTELDYYPVANPTEDIVVGDYDIVHRMWGEKWRMPTEKELKELIDNCTISYDAANKGVTLTSKKNNKSIFLPLGGYREHNDIKSKDTAGQYWSGSLDKNNSDRAAALFVRNSSFSVINVERYFGNMIRPVSDSIPQMAYVQRVDTSEVTTESIKISVAYTGSYDKASEFGVRYSKTSNGLNNGSYKSESVKTVGDDGKCTFELKNLEQNTTYYYYAYVICNNETDKSASATFKTKEIYVAPEVTIGTSAVSNIGESAATVTVLYKGDVDKVTEFGLCYGTSEGVSLNNSKKVTGKIANGKVAFALTGLQPDTRYYYLPYAVLEGETKTGAQGGFKTNPVHVDEPKEASVSKVELGTVSHSSAVIKAVFAGDYKYATTFGVRYSKTEEGLNNDYVTIDASSVNSDGTKDFSLVGLDSETTYHYYVFVICDDKTARSENGTFTTGTKTTSFPVPGHVDLGLSIEWATWNIGAATEYEYGSYVAWGDPTCVNESFLSSDYPHHVETIAGTSYDPATVQWGENWRMPTMAEWKELCALPRTLVVDNNTGFAYYRITGRNGKSIVLPLAGVINGPGSLKYQGQASYYWSSEETTQAEAACCDISDYSLTEKSYNKALHMPVRAVYFDKSSIPEETPEGQSALEVDLGLSVKWASSNIGAASSSDIGDFFAWCETDTKSEYSRDTYKYCTKNVYKDALGNDSVVYTFNIPTTEYSGNVEYDAARKQWGGTWRTPTKKEMQELIDECTWEAVTGGYKITGPSGKSIFLPHTGVYEDKNKSLMANCWYWTSSYNIKNIHKDDYYGECLATESSVGAYIPGNYSFYGMPIRPVKK